MEQNQKYTFGPEEKEILEILSSFENEINERLQQSNGELESVKYYDSFAIQGVKQLEISGVFLTQEKDKDGNIGYHLYYKDSSNEILSIDKDGNMHINPLWKEVIGEIDFEKSIEINDREPGRLKGISEKMTPEEMEKALKEEKKTEDKQQKDGKGKEPTPEEVEQSLQEQGQDLGISSIRMIKDKHLSERMPQAFDKSAEYGLAYSNKLNSYVIVARVNGEFQLNDNIQPAQTTMKRVISIDEKGERIEEKVPHALMKTNDSSKEVAVTIGQYGYLDIETVDRLPCNERVARQVGIEGEGVQGQESYEMRKTFETEGKEYPHQLAHQVEEVQEAQQESTGEKDYDITEDDYIPNTQKTWGELMDDTGESLPKLIERYNREMQKEGVESEKAVQTIEEDYGNVSHEHNRN